MIIPYSIFSISCILTVLSTCMNKQYQLKTGTGLIASSVYMIINGLISAIIPMVMLLLTGSSLEWSPYSFIMASVTVICSAINVIASFKVYESGQIAVTTIFVTIGSIVLSCAWGILFLHETLTATQIVGILLMLAAVLLTSMQKDMKIDKHLWALLFLAAVTAGMTSILSKEHQIEQHFKTIDTYSYSIWIGLVRLLLFTLILLFLKNKRAISEYVTWSQSSLLYASLASIAGGVSYIAILITAKVLPLTITSPLSTALNILLTTIMSRIVFHEKMNRKQQAGVLLCLLGIFVFA